MHVVIDKAKLGFLPIKHELISVVCDLVCLEAPNAQVYVCPLDHNFLNPYTDLELMLLYKNTTGEQAMRTGDSLRNILFELATRIEVSKVNAFELSVQVNVVQDYSSDRYQYCFGSHRPTKKDNFFKLDIVKVPKAPNELDIAKSARGNRISA